MVINDAFATVIVRLFFQSGLKVTLNNTISGNGNLVDPAAVAHFNKTNMYTGTGTLTVQGGASPILTSRLPRQERWHVYNQRRRINRLYQPAHST